MSASRKFFISTLLIIAVAAGGAVLGSKIVMQRSEKENVERNLVQKVEKSSPDNIQENYSFEQFDSLYTQGSWNVTIEKGERYSVQIDIPRRAKEEVEVNLDTNTLILGLDSWMTALTKGTMKAKIVTPELEKIEAEGGSKVTFSGFEGEKLEMICKGAIQAVGDGNRYDELTIDADGAVTIDLKNSDVERARVELSGTGKVEIALLDGGSLSGSIEGLGKITYSGDDIEVSFDSGKGLSNIEHLDSFEQD
jgi:hypothetical protein